MKLLGFSQYTNNSKSPEDKEGQPLVKDIMLLPRGGLGLNISEKEVGVAVRTFSWKRFNK